MKKRNIFVSITLVAVFFSTQLSFTVAAPNKKRDFGPGFEIFNKSPRPITVAVMIGNETITKTVFPQEKFPKTISLDAPILLGLYDGIINEKIKFYALKEQITPYPHRMVTIKAPEKTKYLTWNPNKSPYLYPQTGPFRGLLVRTESGHPLGINLEQSDIKHAITDL